MPPYAKYMLGKCFNAVKFLHSNVFSFVCLWETFWFSTTYAIFIYRSCMICRHTIHMVICAILLLCYYAVYQNIIIKLFIIRYGCMHACIKWFAIQKRNTQLISINLFYGFLKLKQTKSFIHINIYIHSYHKHTCTGK